MRISLFADSIKVPPERSMAKGAKVLCRHFHAPADVEHYEPLQQGPCFEHNLPYIVLAEDAFLHAAFQGRRRELSRRRLACAKVFRELARSLAPVQKHQLEHPWILKTKINKHVHYSHQLLLGIDRKSVV